MSGVRVSARISALVRSASLFGLWVVLIGIHPADVIVGLITAAAATWISLGLLPPQIETLRPRALPHLALRFIRQSLVAGFDVARRALHPRLPLRPGFTSCAVGFPPGPLRSAFLAMTSLLPGTIAVSVVRDDAQLYHCLDLDQPVAAQLAVEEGVVRQALRGARP